ncbi:MAG TPA: indolepyruvate oxidoreductase subunit beta [Candidatus Faecivivens stercoripullorum]|uniref:Indolepyruvate oxidoreductase subunit beta n=1 Tax=Candidatus Faecivivens stercoripullorum TaxID=2840805 RepID=A0A9D1H5T0_9FIRM|nr:indolepyruvate oxidoreductase subunit beta [Candidatus Faecivivens stercoripullorum]
MNKDILLCGVGGQGIVLVSKLLAASAMAAGETVHSAETIGMAQRGGSVTSHVRIGQSYSPLIPSGSASLMLAFEPGEAVRNLPLLSKDGTVIVSNTAVMPVTASLSGGSYQAEPMLDFLRKRVKKVITADPGQLCAPLGSVKYFNVVMLGIALAAGVTGLPEEIVRKTVETKVPEKFREINTKALTIGEEYYKTIAG